MSYATFEDVEVRFFRDLLPEERDLVEARLDDAEGKIRSRIRNLDQKVLENPDYLSTVVRVCVDAVIRLIRNPEGFVQETDGNYTYMLSQSSAEGRLTILTEEWQDLGIRKSVGVVHTIPLLPESLRDTL